MLFPSTEKTYMENKDHTPVENIIYICFSQLSFFLTRRHSVPYPAVTEVRGRPKAAQTAHHSVPWSKGTGVFAGKKKEKFFSRHAVVGHNYNILSV